MTPGNREPIGRGSPLGAAYILATDQQFLELSNLTKPPRAGRIIALEANGQVRVESDDPDGGDVLAWPLNGFSYAVNDVVYLAFAVNAPDSAIVVGVRGTLPTLSLVAFKANTIAAADNTGIYLTDDAGNLGVFVADGGNVIIGPGTPTTPANLNISATGHIVALVEGTLSGRLRLGATASSSGARNFEFTSRNDTLQISALNDAWSAYLQQYIFTAGPDGAITLGLPAAGSQILSLRAGASTNDAAVGGLLYVASAAAGSVGSTLTTLQTYTVPANTLNLNNQSIWFKAYGSFAANSNSKAVFVTWGTNSWQMIGNPMNLNNTTWSIEGRIIRTGAATQKVPIQSLDWATISPNGQLTIGAGTMTLSSAQVLAVKATGVANNDIVCETLLIGWDDQNV